MTKQDQTQADFLAEEGKSLYQAKKYLPAADSFSQSAAAYDASGYPLLGAEMRNNQCVSLLLAKKPRQAVEVVQGTGELFIKAGQITKAGMALANEATALKDLGDNESALETFTRAGDLFLSVDEEDLYLQTMQSVSSLKMKSRNVLGALFSMQKGLEGIEKPTWKQKLLKNLLKVPDKLLNK
jgi:tetratricopeptide (TPR) repeat protein